MTYYDTQQQYLNNPQFNPQQWAPLNSQTGGDGLGQSAPARPLGTSGERGRAPIGASPASDCGSGTTACGNRICRLRTNAAPAEPAGGERSGEADPANRATDCRSAAGPAAITARRH